MKQTELLGNPPSYQTQSTCLLYASYAYYLPTGTNSVTIDWGNEIHFSSQLGLGRSGDNTRACFCIYLFLLLLKYMYTYAETNVYQIYKKFTRVVFG